MYPPSQTRYRTFLSLSEVLRFLGSSLPLLIQSIYWSWLTCRGRGKSCVLFFFFPKMYVIVPLWSPTDTDNDIETRTSSTVGEGSRWKGIYMVYLIFLSFLTFTDGVCL